MQNQVMRECCCVKIHKGRMCIYFDEVEKVYKHRKAEEMRICENSWRKTAPYQKRVLFGQDALSVSPLYQHCRLRMWDTNMPEPQYFPKAALNQFFQRVLTQTSE
jgi:hypothetical protein